MSTPRCSAWELDPSAVDGHRQCGLHFDPNYGSGCVLHPLGVGSDHAAVDGTRMACTPDGVLQVV